MDASTRAFVQQLLQDQETLERQCQMLQQMCGLAWEIASREGHPLPAALPQAGLPLDAIADTCLRPLVERVHALRAVEAEAPRLEAPNAV